MNTTTLAGNSFSWVRQTSWQAAVLVVLVLVVQMIFRQKLSPAWRYGLWLLVVVRLLLPSAPPTSWSIFNVAKLPLTLASVGSASLPRTVPANPVLQVPGTSASVQPAAAGTVAGTVGGNLASVRIPNWQPVALLVWLLGLCFFATRLLCSNLRFCLRIAAEPAVTNESARRQFDECRSELGTRQAVKLIETEEVESPAVHGLWRKRLLLPKGIFDRFSSEQMRCIFLHELAHIKRRDLEVNWLVSVLQALHWFNPLLWLGFGRMRADREMACDALALAHLGKAPAESYGETIISVVENLVRPPSARGLLALSEDKRQLEQRIRMIAAFRGRPGMLRHQPISAGLAAGLMTGLAAVTLACLTFTGSSQQPPAVPEPAASQAATNGSASNGLSGAGLPIERNVKASTLVRDGKLLYELGKFEEAEVKFTQAVQADPQDKAANCHLKFVNDVIERRNTVQMKLSRIRLDSISFDQLPLREVVRVLADETRKSDPEKHGVNFVIFSADSKSASAEAIPKSGTGLPSPAASAGTENLYSLAITIRPPLVDIRLVDVLDAIVKVAGQPIKYSIEEYGVVFSASTSSEPPMLHVRVFKVDPNTVLGGLRTEMGLGATNAPGALDFALRNHLAKAGVNLGAPKTIFFNDRQGVLVIRATLGDLYVVERAIQLLGVATPAR